MFDSVFFSYGEKSALENINLRIKSGQLVAFVGASGSGKTTLANLVLRFYDPSQGSVQIGGVDLRDVSTKDLRQHIAVVAQENVLFNETIRRNIELGRPGATEDEIVSAAKSANAHEFILAKPEGYLTKIGEKGVTLSGGQAHARSNDALHCASSFHHPARGYDRGHAAGTHCRDGDSCGINGTERSVPKIIRFTVLRLTTAN